jgi:hypothetical protein
MVKSGSIEHESSLSNNNWGELYFSKKISLTLLYFFMQLKGLSTPGEQMYTSGACHPIM